MANGETLLEEWHRGTRRIAGTDWPVVDQVKRLGRGRYLAVRGLCNGVPEAVVRFGRAKDAIALLEQAAKAAADRTATERLAVEDKPEPERCIYCGGPVREHARGKGVWLHDNSSGWYAGREMTHDAEVAGDEAELGERVLPCRACLCEVETGRPASNLLVHTCVGSNASPGKIW